MFLWLLWWCSGSCHQVQGRLLVNQIRPGQCLQAHTHQKPGLASFRLILGPPASGQFYVPPLLCGPFSSIWAVQLPSPVQWICRCPSICHENKQSAGLATLSGWLLHCWPTTVSSLCQQHCNMIATCEELGFAINSEKVTKPATTMNFLGIDIDSVAMEATNDPTHLSETISLLKDHCGPSIHHQMVHSDSDRHTSLHVPHLQAW